MNFTSKVFNRSAIYYFASQREKEALLIGKLSVDAKRSPKKAGDGNASTKDWVLQSFHPNPKTADSISASVGDQENTTQKIPDHRSEPSVHFDQSLIDTHAEKFKFCLVGRFPGSRPSLAQIRGWVAKEWKLRGDWSITLLDPQHVFVRLDNQDDMISVWARNRCFINGKHLMKIFRWSSSFRPSNIEPSLAAIWVSFPLLPVVLFQEELLFSLASLVGKVLAMDGPTRNLTRTNVARVCLEVDLLKELPRRIWIEIGDGGFWQDIDYEKLPSYCNGCHQQGHSSKICKFNKNYSLVKELNTNFSLVDQSSVIKEGWSSKEQQGAAICAVVNDQSILEGSSHLPFNRCSIVESIKIKDREDTESKNVQSYVLTTKQGLDSNGPIKMPDERISILEKTEDLGIIGREEVEQDEKFLRDHALILEEEEVEEEEEEDEEEEEEGGGEDDELTTKELERSHHEQKWQGHVTTPPTFGRRRYSSRKPIFFWKRKLKTTKAIDAILEDLSPIRYTHSDVKKMTNSFRELIGQGGSCKVFKGKLPDGRLVAVKVPMNSRASQTLVNEIEMIRWTSHVNIIRLLGFCSEGTKIALILEFLPNGSLFDILDRKEGLSSLSGERLHQIAVGVARGLEYLRYGCNTPIVHFDIKPGNILLDENFKPRICDFGLSRFCGNDSSSPLSFIKGTRGYIAPELMGNSFSSKIDVFSYGMALLEISTKRRILDLDAISEEIYIVNWIYGKLNQEGSTGLGQIAGMAEDETERKMILVGLWCIQTKPEDRPSISRVLQMLEGNIDEIQIPPNTSPIRICSTPFKFSSDSSSGSEESTRIKNST